MVRRMKVPELWRDYLAGVYEPLVEAVNCLVDDLREAEPPSGRGWVPYIAPVQCGSRARILGILRDPGPGTYDA
jgi:hypothetical protein